MLRDVGIVEEMLYIIIRLLQNKIITPGSGSSVNHSVYTIILFKYIHCGVNCLLGSMSFIAT